MNALTLGSVERKKCRNQGWEPGRGTWEGAGTMGRSEDRRVQCHSSKKRKPREHAKCCGLAIKRPQNAPWVCQWEVIGDADEGGGGNEQISGGQRLDER